MRRHRRGARRRDGASPLYDLPHDREASRQTQMANILTELWWLLKHGRGWREEHRSFPHPRLGEFRFTGTRARPGAQAHGYWKVQPPGFDDAIGVDFQFENGDPTPEGLALLETLLGDLDALFERCRPHAEQEYAQMVEEPMPHDWRSAFRLEHISLPDTDERDSEWQVTYWCEPALHWLVVTFRGDEVIDAGFDG